MTKKFSLFTLLAVLPLAIVLVAALHGDRAAQAQETVSPNDVAKQLTGIGRRRRPLDHGEQPRDAGRGAPDLPLRHLR